MKLIQSLEDLEQARAEAAERQKSAAAGNIHIRIGMASCGIAAGAKDTLRVIQQIIASQGLSGIQVIKTGCLGLCVLEPIVQVQMHNQPTITYGRVTPEVARRIIEQHVKRGMIVPEYIVESY
jgi:NADP-reducing hydrogenase subunit HndB